MSELRGAGTMALGTVASRGTGFLRTAVLVAVLGVQGVPLAFTVANTAPNIVYELLLGGILTSTVVPLLVRAESDGHGEAYAQRLLTLTVLVLGGTAVLLVILAPQVVDLYLNQKVDDATRDLAITFARFFLPQVLFYGVGALLGAWLNTHRRFGPPMWAPVLNNVVVIVTLAVFAVMPGPDHLTSSTISDTQVLVLGLGVTLGIVAQTVALLPALRSTGFRFSLRFDLRDTGLSEAARLARWTFFYVVCNQLVLLVVVRLASGAPLDRGYPSYTNAFLLWQLPHAVVAVSVITALLPAMSRAAHDGRLEVVRAQLDRGLRATTTLMVPAAVALAVLGPQLATAVFGHGRTTVDQARFIGELLAVFACGLVAFSAYQLQLRAFYALQDTRTPALVNLVVNAVTVVVDVVLYVSLPDRWKVLGLAVGQASSYLVGVVVCTTVLARRVPRDPDGHVLRTTVRCLAATVVPAAVALLVAHLAERALGTATAGSLVASAAGGAVLVVGYVVAARRLRVRELDDLLAPLLRTAQGGRSISRTREGE
ncbi:MAG TPA: murein biosynthesis integral membrane protein MurJ [Mycobacteriales bacterium]|nr:murein biosynthesis integral membrane protein MurJ [Mycobacteriales bacterium]